MSDHEARARLMTRMGDRLWGMLVARMSGQPVTADAVTMERRIAMLIVHGATADRLRVLDERKVLLTTLAGVYERLLAHSFRHPE